MKTFTVHVKTKQREETVTESTPGSLIVKTKAMPIEGKANVAVIELLAKHFGVSKQHVKIKTGSHSKTKIATIEIE